MALPSDGPQPLTVGEALLPVAGLIILLAMAYFLFGDAAAGGPNQIALTIGALIAVYVGWRRGHSLDSLRDAAVAGVNTGIGAIFILLAVGSLIGTWAMSGTLTAMVYYGMMLLSPNYFYFTTCLICAVVAMSVGSSWTVAGTIGIGLVAIADRMGLDPAITAGAILSGAYFGDKSSPLSDTANLACAAAGANLYTHIVEALWTSIPALVIALAFFWWLGSPGDFDASASLSTIRDVLAPSFWDFLPLLLVLGLALRRTPPFITIFAGAMAGGLLAVIRVPERVIAFADVSYLPDALALLKGVWGALATGYVSNTGFAAADAFLSRGGMESMLDTIWLIIVALAFGGVVEKAGVLERLITPVIKAARSVGALIASLVGAAIATNMLAADQYIAVVLPGRMFRGAFQQRGLAPVVLSRAVGDAAIVTAPLVPWNSCGAFMAATLGVATTAYLPYAMFNLIMPLITIAFGMFGWRMLRAEPPAAQPAR